MRNDDISAVLNRAADDVLEAIDAPNEGVRDVINLLVNVTAARLLVPGIDVRSVIREYYDADPETVLGWCNA